MRNIDTIIIHCAVTRPKWWEGKTSQENHNEVSAKACPGFQVGPWLKDKPVRTNPARSKTVQASVATAAGGVGTAASALSGLDQYAQYIVLGFAGLVVLGALFIMRERLKAWAAGWR